MIIDWMKMTRQFSLAAASLQALPKTIFDLFLKAVAAFFSGWVIFLGLDT